MGVSPSTPIPGHIRAVQKWQWSQLTATIKTYNELELPFGINAANIATITGMRVSDAKQIVQMLAKQPDTGFVNSLTVLSALILMADENEGTQEARIEALYDLIDFDCTTQATYDELAILFLCCGAALAGILQMCPDSLPTCPDDGVCRRLASQVYHDLEKDNSDILTKSEFASWVTSFLSELKEVSADTVYVSLYSR